MASSSLRMARPPAVEGARRRSRLVLSLAEPARSRGRRPAAGLRAHGSFPPRCRGAAVSASASAASPGPPHVHGRARSWAVGRNSASLRDAAHGSSCPGAAQRRYHAQLGERLEVGPVRRSSVIRPSRTSRPAPGRVVEDGEKMNVSCTGTVGPFAHIPPCASTASISRTRRQLARQPARAAVDPRRRAERRPRRGLHVASGGAQRGGQQKRRVAPARERHGQARRARENASSARFTSARDPSPSCGLFLEQSAARPSPSRSDMLRARARTRRS